MAEVSGHWRHPAGGGDPFWVRPYKRKGEFGIGRGSNPFDKNSMELIVERPLTAPGGPYVSVEALEEIRDTMLKFVGERMMAYNPTKDDPINEVRVRMTVIINGKEVG